MVPDRHGKTNPRNSAIPLAIEVDEAVLYAKTHVPIYLVFEARAQCPTVAPAVEREAIRRSRVAPGKVNLCPGPSGLAVKQPLIGSVAEATRYGRDGIDAGAEVHGRKCDAAEISIEISAANGGLHAQQEVADL